MQSDQEYDSHAGYARYFTPPPLELVQSQSINKFAGTSNQSAVSQSLHVQPERGHYFDAGMTEQFTRAFSMGIDGYYKISRNLIEESQSGSALTFSPFNYAEENQYGFEVTANYTQGGFNAYANLVSNRHRRKNCFRTIPFRILTSSLSFAITGSSWTMISAIPFLPALLTLSKTLRYMLTSSMAAAWKWFCEHR